MEAVRPAVEAYVLVLLTQRTLSPRQFVETREGSCRITPLFAAQLANTCTLWRARIAPVVERVAHLLIEHSGSEIPSLTPLTRRNWKRAWDSRKPDHRQRISRGEFAALPDTCRDCGSPLPDRRRHYCDECRKRRFAEQAVTARQKGFQVLAQLQAGQRDPAHGGRAAEVRGRKNAAHQAAVRTRKGRRPDPSVFQSEILPALRMRPIAELMAATGLSQHYCSLIRLRKRVRILGTGRPYVVFSAILTRIQGSDRSCMLAASCRDGCCNSRR